jgi:hypothetical protein
MSSGGIQYDQETFTDDDLTVAIGQLGALRTVSHRHLLGFVAEFANRQAYLQDGARNMAEWLSARLNIPYNEAKRWVKVAMELHRLPAIAAAFEAGLLNFAQVELLVRIADHDNDAELAEMAQGRSVAELTTLVQRERPPEDEGAALDAKTALRWRITEDGRTIKGNFEFPVADGVALTKRIEAEVARAPELHYTGTREPFSYQAGKALLGLARNEPSEKLTKATVVIHGDASFIVHEGGSAEVEEGPAIPHETLARYLCDCHIETLVVQPDGSLGVGRKRRSVPRPLERRIRRRDGGCRFPGCGLNRWTEIHHMATWALDLGETNEGNLITLCLFHHHFLHEQRWKATGSANGVVSFWNGACEYKTGPPPLRPSILAA